jgi:hypothetical protein
MSLSYSCEWLVRHVGVIGSQFMNDSPSKRPALPKRRPLCAKRTVLTNRRTGRRSTPISRSGVLIEFG